MVYYACTYLFVADFGIKETSRLLEWAPEIILTCTLRADSAVAHWSSGLLSGPISAL